MTAKPTHQDFINALEQQRNDALNEVVNLRAEIAAMQRELARQRTEGEGRE